MLIIQDNSFHLHSADHARSLGVSQQKAVQRKTREAGATSQAHGALSFVQQELGPSVSLCSKEVLCACNLEFLLLRKQKYVPLPHISSLPENVHGRGERTGEVRRKKTRRERP